MFADEVADLKDAYPARMQLVHVLSREPQEVELFTGRLDADKLRTLLPVTVDVAAVDHWWLCGPFGMVTDAIDVLAELGVPPRPDAPRAVLRRGRPARPRLHHEDAPAGPAPRSPSSWTAAAPRSPSPPGDAGARRAPSRSGPTCRSPARAACAAPAGRRVDRRRGADAPQLRPRADEVDAGYVLTCQSLPVTDAVTVDYDS